MDTRGHGAWPHPAKGGGREKIWARYQPARYRRWLRAPTRSLRPAGLGDTMGPASGATALVTTQRLQVSAQYLPVERMSLSQLL